MTCPHCKGELRNLTHPDDSYAPTRRTVKRHSPERLKAIHEETCPGLLRRPGKRPGKVTDEAMAA